MKKELLGVQSIDEYIEGFPDETRKILIQIRNIVKKAAPDATEKISYGMPTFSLGGNLIHFAAYRNHIGLYPAPTGMDAFREELSKYEGGKGSVKFPLQQPMPYKLIGQIVEFRVAENMEKIKEKANINKRKI